MHVVTVTLRVKAAHMQDFLQAIDQNAKRSLEVEAGCRCFDICVSLADANAVFLYELYDDRQAFDRHLSSDHFKTFDRATADWIETKEVLQFARH